MAASSIVSGFISTQLPSGGTAIKFVIVFAVVILICGMLGFLTYIVAMRKRYNKRIKLFKKIGGNIVMIATDSAMFERIGIGGDFWCKTRTAKKIVPKPRIQMEGNTYWMYEREDGEWINFRLENIDEKMHLANAYFVDEDMRLQRLGIQKNLAQRFQKITFMERYGGVIMFAVFILIVTVCLVVLFQKMQTSYQGATEMSAAVRDMAIQVSNLLSHTTSGVQTLN